MGLLTWVALLQGRFHFSGFTFSPHSPFFSYWDGLAICLLIILAVHTPFEVSFLDLKPQSFLWYFNRCLDIVRPLQPLVV